MGLLVGCGGVGGDGPACDDPKYGDGTCHVDTSCSVPDIDCFTTFETQADAQAWYASTRAATERPPLPADNPRFARMQELLDQGWEAYKSVNPVGDLASERVHLVFADQAIPNAFVTQKDDRAGLVVMVAPPLIDLGAPDEQLMGVVMHELEHTIGLHVLPAVAAGFNKYYIAPIGSEPLGFEQSDDPVVRGLLEEWIDQATVVGYLDDPELAGLPIVGPMSNAFNKRLAMQPATGGCAAARTTLNSLRQKVLDGRNLIDDSVTLIPTAPTLFLNAMQDVQTQCFAGFMPDAIDVVAADLEVARAELLKLIPANLLPLLDGQPYIGGMYSANVQGRAKMREIEARFQMRTGLPWTRVRYFSTEEAADDSSVPVLRAMGLAPDGAGLLFPKLGGLDVEAACRPLVNGNQPIPYGENLEDNHHALCWRAAHIKAVADAGRSRVAAPLVLHPRKQTISSMQFKPYSH